MKPIAVIISLLLFCLPAYGSEKRVYMIGKVKIQDTTHTTVALFYDEGVSTMAECQREIQRGIRGQWRYHHHKFDNPRGYSRRIDYYCVVSEVKTTSWTKSGRYDEVYKIDIRNTNLQISPQRSYSDCLHSVRREVADETSKFFCAKVSQRITL